MTKICDTYDQMVAEAKNWKLQGWNVIPFTAMDSGEVGYSIFRLVDGKEVCHLLRFLPWGPRQWENEPLQATTLEQLQALLVEYQRYECFPLDDHSPQAWGFVHFEIPGKVRSFQADKELCRQLPESDWYDFVSFRLSTEKRSIPGTPLRAPTLWKLGLQ